MAFIDARFPEDISYGAQGGPEFSTDVVVVASGYEQRNANWTLARGSWDVAHAARTKTQIDALVAFFRVAKGRANAFRFKDWMDFQVTSAQGGLDTTGHGTGLPTYQLYKNYTSTDTHQRKITRPVSGLNTIYRNASPVTFGVSAGNVALDAATGIATFVADATSGVNSVTVGATTTVVLATNPGTLTATQKLYLSGLTGTHASLLNNLAHTINSVTGAGPYTFVLATNTAGKTISAGSGIGSKFPQSTDALTWSGEFDVPARFDTDKLNGEYITRGILGWSGIPIVEVRE